MQLTFSAVKSLTLTCAIILGCAASGDAHPCARDYVTAEPGLLCAKPVKIDTDLKVLGGEVPAGTRR